MIKHGLVIPTHDAPYWVDLDEGIRAIQEAVGGFFGQIIGRPTFAMYANDEAKYIAGSSENVAATGLARHCGTIKSGDWIAGQTIIVGIEDTKTFRGVVDLSESHPVAKAMLAGKFK